MAKSAFKRGLFRLLGPRAYARMQAEFFFLRLLAALRSPRFARRFFGRDILAFARRLKPGDTVLDIGAYLGGTAALFARAVGPAGRVISFEPYHHGYLRALLRRLGALGRVRAVAAALGGEEGTAALSVPLHAGVPLYSQAALVPVPAPAGAGALRGEPVPMRTLDGFLAGEGISPAAIAAVKIDVEGSEMGLFAGAPGFLRDFRGFLLCEFWFDAMPPPGWRHLRSLGYACRYLGRDGRARPADTEEQLRELARGETFGNFWWEKPAP